MTRKFFVSFTGLIREMLQGKVSDDDLRCGLFYFGCTREHAFNPGDQGENNELEYFSRDSAIAVQTAHERLKKALVVAESEKRVLWRRPDEGNTYRHVNELLEGAGFDRPILEERDGFSLFHYSYPGVATRFAESGLDQSFQVVY